MVKVYYMNGNMTELAMNMKMKQLNSNLKDAYKRGDLDRIELYCKQINKLKIKQDQGVEV